jgi:hypothetical protein
VVGFLEDRPKPAESLTPSAGILSPPPQGPSSGGGRWPPTQSCASESLRTGYRWRCHSHGWACGAHSPAGLANYTGLCLITCTDPVTSLIQNY